MKRSAIAVIFAAVAILGPTAAQAADPPGQADLDKAVTSKVDAKSLADLDKVVELCESAIRKGIKKEDEPFAIDLLTGTLMEYASRLSAAIFDRTPPDPRWQLLRQVALRKLESAVEYNARFADAHMLIARLHGLPGGNRGRGRQAANQAVKLAGADKKQLSKALLMRGNLTDQAEGKLADYNQAVQIDPENHDARRTRGVFHLARGDSDKAIADFREVLKGDAKNVTTHHALAEALIGMKKFDEAKKHADQAIRLQPKGALGYTLRARIHAIQEDAKAALADLDQAVKHAPGDVNTLLTRSRLHQIMGHSKEARQDIDRALALRPGLPQAILQRSMISAAEGKFDSALSDIEGLLQGNPKNGPLRMQKATLLAASQRPRASIALYAELLGENPQNTQALRGKADALLSIGKHAEAIADFEKLLKLQPENDGALNNLAWVLATSPDDKIRDSKRSIELAKRACEVTQYKRPHILSTLAAGYAEAGDFEEAIKWSSKAVEMGDEKIKEQLSKELESYKKKKPWRELQQVKEKPAPGPRGGAFEL